MPNIVHLLPKSEQIASAKAEQFRQAVLDFGFPEKMETDILATVQRHETGGLAGWRFNMINASQCLAVWQACKTAEKPIITRDVFDYALTHVETNTGVVVLSREEIAEKVGVPPQEVSRAMGELEKFGAIIRERIRVDGMKGPGKARYRINPHVAWNGSLDRRVLEAKKAAPVQENLPFEVIDGGGDAA